MIKPIYWDSECLMVLDQVQLPLIEHEISIADVEACITVIKDMNVRGAPCIGFVAIFGAAFIVRDFDISEWEKKATELVNSRPTAVNLSFEVERTMKLASKLVQSEDKFSVYQKIIDFALNAIKEGQEKHLEMAHWGEVALRKYVHKDRFKIQTHCNTGVLACGVLGTALGVIEKLAEKNAIEKVWVDETRPYLQGSRLTAYELEKNSIPYDVVVEGAASYLMSRGHVDAIFVGADRIAANGDVANKVGTAGLAIIAKRYNVPFFVVAPLSSFDFKLKTGSEIEVETRAELEILTYKDQRIAPYSATAFNPSFDITPAELITGIISEKGIVERPTTIKMETLFGSSSE